MNEQAASVSSRRAQVLLGLLLITGGVVLLATHRDIWYLMTLWPLIVVGIGANKIAGACCAGDRRSGIWLLALGLWFAVNEFTSLGYHDTWPLLLVVAGSLWTWDAASPAARCQTCQEGRRGR